MKKIVFAIALGVVQALASPIILYNTGSDPSAPVDLHWTIDGKAAYVTDSSAFPFPSWLPDNGVSSFISPRPSYANSLSDPASTVFNFDTTFVLPSYDPGAAFLNMRVLVDNQLESVWLNGHALTDQDMADITYVAGTIDTPTSYSVWSPNYRIDQYLVAGPNKLEFRVMNATGTTGNPTGLRVEFVDSYDGVPEPGTLASLAGGLGLIGLFLRRKRLPAA